MSDFPLQKPVLIHTTFSLSPTFTDTSTYKFIGQGLIKEATISITRPLSEEETEFQKEYEKPIGGYKNMIGNIQAVKNNPKDKTYG